MELTKLSVKNLQFLDEVLGLNAMVNTGASSLKSELLAVMYEGIQKLSDNQDCFKLEKSALEQAEFYKSKFEVMTDANWSELKIALVNDRKLRIRIEQILEGFVQPLSKDEAEDESEEEEAEVVDPLVAEDASSQDEVVSDIDNIDWLDSHTCPFGHLGGQHGCDFCNSGHLDKSGTDNLNEFLKEQEWTEHNVKKHYELTKIWTGNNDKAEDESEEEEAEVVDPLVTEDAKIQEQEAKPNWQEASPRMTKCLTCNMAWFSDCKADCKCHIEEEVETPIDVRALCKNNDIHEKFEIELDMSVKPQKNKVMMSLTTRASFGQPHKFKPVDLHLDPSRTIASLRRAVSFAIHGALNRDLDSLMDCPLKDVNTGMVLKSDTDDMTIETWLRLTGGNELKLNMTMDGYKAGGAKKGSKKFVNKEVRLSTMRAKVQYLGSTLQHSTYASLIQQVAQGSYAESALNQMSLDQLLALQLVANDVVRVDKVAKAVPDHMVPQLVQMRLQKDELENVIKAIEDGFELGFAEQYYSDTGFDADPFYTLMQSRIDVLTEQSIQQQAQQQAYDQMQNQMNDQMEAEIQRRLAAMGIPPSAQFDADDAM